MEEVKVDFLKVKADKLSYSMRKLKYGVGVNDAWYKTNPKCCGKTITCPVYRTWDNMLERCYSGGYPSYKNCSVCDDWKVFSNFKIWYDINYKEGYDLDKDLKIKGNLIYSPTTCLFIPNKLNKFLILFSENPCGRLKGYTGTKSGKFLSQIRDGNKI